MFQTVCATTFPTASVDVATVREQQFGFQINQQVEEQIKYLLNPSNETSHHTTLQSTQLQDNALTTLLKHQLKQSIAMERRSSTTSMNEILQMVVMASPLGFQQEDSKMIEKLGSYAGMIQSPSYSQIISNFNDLKSRSQILERELKQITELSSNQDRSSLKESVISVLYQIIDEVLSDTTSSLPLCWSTSQNKGDSEQIIKTLSLKWENEQNQNMSPIEQHLRQYLSEHGFLSNQELIDLMVNSHNLLEESNSISDGNSTTNSFNNTLQSDQLDTMTTTEEILSLFPSAETFDAVFRSLGESSTNPKLIISLDSSEEDGRPLNTEFVHESLSNNSSPQITIVNTTTLPNNEMGESPHEPTDLPLPKKHLLVQKKSHPTSSKISKSNADKNQLFGSFLLKTSSSFETTKISKTRKSSKSAPAQLVEKANSDFSRGFLHWNWKEQPRRSKTPNNEPEIENNIN